MDRELHDGDVLDFGGGAHVLEIPGHTEGSIAVHLPAHGVLFTGDTIANVGSVMLGVFNQDRARTVASFQRLAALDVETACFGHGEPIVPRAGDRIRDGGCHTDDMIEPDTKDWTWVIARPCPECGFDPSTVQPHRGRRSHSRRRRRLAAQAQRRRRHARAHARRCGRRWSTAATSATCTGSSTSASG